MKIKLLGMNHDRQTYIMNQDRIFFIIIIIYLFYYLFYFIFLNPCHAEPGYNLPLQTA